MSVTQTNQAADLLARVPLFEEGVPLVVSSPPPPTCSCGSLMAPKKTEKSKRAKDDLGESLSGAER